MNEIYELGKNIKKQLKKKNAFHHTTMLGNIITSGSNDNSALEYLMKIVSGYELKVDLTPLTKVVETNELHTGLQMLLAGMLSE